jgi:hypothetical protein
VEGEADVGAACIEEVADSFGGRLVVAGAMEALE